MVNIPSVLKRAVPTAFAFATGGPIAAGITAVQTEQAIKRQQQFERDAAMINRPPSAPGSYFSDLGSPPVNVSQPGFFSPGGTLSNIGTAVGGFFDSVSPVLDFFSRRNTTGGMAPPAAQTVITQPPQETAMSGELSGANLGLAGPLVQAGRSLITSPAGQAGLGAAGGLIAAGLMEPGGRKPRITRRMKADVRRIYMMSGMDPAATAAILNNLGTYPNINFDVNGVFFILTKRFRNDGPVVTKAAVRKTRTTLRRMKGVVDMYNSVCKPTTRRAPARRATKTSTTLIKN